jgi:hypothetical protein
MKLYVAIRTDLSTLLTSLQQGKITLAPKKPNWDLKRDVARKLDKLEKRTQLAIIEMLKEQQEQEQPGGMQS